MAVRAKLPAGAKDVSEEEEAGSAKEGAQVQEEEAAKEAHAKRLATPAKMLRECCCAIGVARWRTQAMVCLRRVLP